MIKKLCKTYLLLLCAAATSYSTIQCAADEDKKSQSSQDHAIKVINGVIESLATSGRYNTKSTGLKLVFIATSALLMEEHINGDNEKIISYIPSGVPSSLLDSYKVKLESFKPIVINPSAITAPVCVACYDSINKKLATSFILEQDMVKQLLKKNNSTKRFENPSKYVRYDRDFREKAIADILPKNITLPIKQFFKSEHFLYGKAIGPIPQKIKLYSHGYKGKYEKSSNLQLNIC